MSRIMGIDWGKRRVGIAISDPTRAVARPLTILKGPKPIRAVAELVKQHDVSEVIVGYPLSWDDSENQRCAEVLDFISSLRKRLRVPVRAVDEWGSSQGTRDDAEAAARILQYYLDTGDKLEI